ncbi:hypothetical protein L596_028337 [Steinernema carpocapsae]|uniref:Uncharacterized protein n=1 Tax=Steinernema carpocapsae TaxID=34508 RepID=A0A4U5LY91_STECR|nr:hypothetical protein L596_028337 [Steinernema carpocapsae]
MASGHCIRTILGGGDETKGVPCMAARFAPDGRHVLASKLDNTVYLVDSKEAAILRRYTNHLHGRFFLTPDFSIVPSGTYIVCGSEDGRVFVWDADSEEVVFVFRDDFKSEGVVRSVSCHPSKEIIAFCEGTLVRVWYGGFEPKKEECE